MSPRKGRETPAAESPSLTFLTGMFTFRHHGSSQFPPHRDQCPANAGPLNGGLHELGSNGRKNSLGGFVRRAATNRSFEDKTPEPSCLSGGEEHGRQHKQAVG